MRGDRVSLAKAITLIESNHPTDRQEAEDLINSLLNHTGNSIRIGISGVPGVGKSTFIEQLGKTMIDSGKKIAVLAVDPTSPSSSGSILADKTRMPILSSSSQAYIRPSPAGRTLGGVTNTTRESILVCEAAEFDVIIVETVGVGQSETAVKSMTDCFLLLTMAGGGDELQGIKRGIMEMADMIIINKADGDNIKPSQLASRMYKNVLHLTPKDPSEWPTTVKTCSSLNGDGITDVWKSINRFHEIARENGRFYKNRQSQKLQWLEDSLEQTLIDLVRQSKSTKAMFNEMEDLVISNTVTPSSTVRRFLSKVEINLLPGTNK